MSKDNREEQCNIKSCSEYSENHDLNCMASESICERCNYGENMPEQVTTDSGTDVCEWEMRGESLDVTEPHNETVWCINEYEDWEYCPVCGKPITIKGE